MLTKNLKSNWHRPSINMLMQCTKVVIQFYGVVSAAANIIQESSEEVGRGLKSGICVCTAVTSLQLDLEWV